MDNCIKYFGINFCYKKNLINVISLIVEIGIWKRNVFLEVNVVFIFCCKVEMLIKNFVILLFVIIWIILMKVFIWYYVNNYG